MGKTWNFRRGIIFICASVILVFAAATNYAQTYNYNTTDMSEILNGSDLNTHGFNDTLTVWCHDWVSRTNAGGPTYNSANKMKSCNAFVRFNVNDLYLTTATSAFQYTYRLTYTIYGYTNPADTVSTFTTNSDTLTISYNNYNDNTPFQDIDVKKYSNFYKVRVVLTGLYTQSGGTIAPAVITNPVYQNFQVQADIATQVYNKADYGTGFPLITESYPDIADNKLNVFWNFTSGDTTPVQISPIRYELEWTYIDDYQRNVTTGTISQIPASSLTYNFANNATRVWVDTNEYSIPATYPSGYIVYRVRSVRPDSSKYQYPVYGDWSLSAASGTVSSVAAGSKYTITAPYSHDSLNWQYTISFAEGGKFKHVASFYDGLLKNRQSITRFNSSLNKLIVTDNVYDFEGRPSIKTLPAPVDTRSFSYQQNVDLNSITSKPYKANDYDTGFAVCPGTPILSPLATTALASKYYSSLDADMVGAQKYVPDAQGYPLVQTIYSPGYTDRVQQQGGAGPKLQIGDSNTIYNYYMGAEQPDLNSLFGSNVGWQSYYTMTVSRDPNEQLSMSIKDYQGKQMASSMIGVGPNSADHAIASNDVPGQVRYDEDLLLATPQETIDNQRIADHDFFNEVEGNDSIQYFFKFGPMHACPDQWLSVRARYDYIITDQCNDTVAHQDSILGVNGVLDTEPPTFAGTGLQFHAGVGPYHVHKTLTINPNDVAAVIDTFFNAPPDCYETEPTFIRHEVESRIFPCPGDTTDPCGLKKLLMEQELFPGHKYGTFTMYGDSVVGTSNSIFTGITISNGPTEYRYQDTCIGALLPDTMTIGSVTYYNLRTMRADSFITVYNTAIGLGDYRIAADLLPLHPEYCELKNCFDDTFKIQMMAIPNAQIASSLNRLYMDSLIAHDPAHTVLGIAFDSLARFEGGLMRLDSSLYITAYCACSDTVMYQQCMNSMFQYEISHRLLINDNVKNYYFSQMMSLYFSNRQRFLDAAIISAGTTCSRCALRRMTLIPGAVFSTAFTATGAISVPFITGDSTFAGMTSTSSWMTGALTDTMSDSMATAIADSAGLIYHSSDSLLCFGQVDTILAHLSNCTAGSTTTYNAFKTTLDSLCASGAIANGNYTPAMIRYVIRRNGVSINDLCNPYLISYSTFVPPAAGAGDACQPDTFYHGINALLNDRAVIGALKAPGTAFLDTLKLTTDLFEQNMATASLGGNAYVKLSATFTSVNNTYTLFIYNNPVLGYMPLDTVKIYLHSPACGAVFGIAGDTFTVAATCITTYTQPITTGFVNEFSFAAAVTAKHGVSVTNCTMLGWLDSVQTMQDLNVNISQCVPCTQMRSLYTQFADTMAVYGMVGSDHPNYEQMLQSFMNYSLGQIYTSDQYDAFITSCALADSARMPLYVGYATYVFNSDVSMTAFIDTLNKVDTNYTFNDAYRDSTTLDSITVCISLMGLPMNELWMYKNKMNTYSGAFLKRKIDSAFADVQPTGTIGVLYVSQTSSFNPLTAGIFDTTLVKYRQKNKAVWMTDHFVMQNYYNVIANSTAPTYLISQDAYAISNYIYTHGVSGAVFIPNYQSTIDADYFKPEKKAYLTYTYKYQLLPPYVVLDSVQSNFLLARVPLYLGDQATYVAPFNPNVVTNFYVSGTTGNRLLDTLRMVLNTVSLNNTVNPGHIFLTPNAVTINPPAGDALTAYVCGDGSYWYRYFTTGDTMFNVFVKFPAYISSSAQKSYVVSTIALGLGDSTTRYFTLGVTAPGVTGTLYLNGLATFVIGKNVELDNVLLGQPITGGTTAPPTTDTFNNCERQLLDGAIASGVNDYNHYMDSTRSALQASFMQYAMGDSIQENLLLSYLNQEFDYTLYNYDRAGNLTFTVPPVGVQNRTALSSAQIASVDANRQSNTPALAPTMLYTKMNDYTYNSLNAVVTQITINGGKTRFFYDAAGRLIFSQNADQSKTGYFTYNLYDQQNRIEETGEFKGGCPYFDDFALDKGPLPSCYFSFPLTPPLVGNWYTADPPFVRRLINVPYDSIGIIVRSYNRDDVVMTVYDTVAKALQAITGLDAQTHLRKRVAAVKYFENLSPLDTFFAHYTYATHYSYDADGNVKTLTQDYPALAYLKQQYKRVDYDYDLISGKVNMLSYNRSWPDQYYQKYAYDADNRITNVQTSADGYIWHNDASYQYYEHGPLARVDVGDLHVQGIDYAYTIQGWLKAVNGDTLNTALDMGLDGATTGGTVNAKDAVAFSIDYFKNDYKPISAGYTMQHIPVDSLSLYNGNISRQTVAINAFQRLTKRYIYDQMNRIYRADYSSVNAVNSTLTGLADFHNSYSYDLDGNLQKLIRYGNNAGSGAKVMDSFAYNYGGGGDLYTDQLSSLSDCAPNNYTNDVRLNCSPSTEYTYDPTGNTIKDLVSGQDTIRWNLYSKVTQTVNNAATNSMDFTYDGAGNRVAKTYTQITDTGNLENTDYYVHDAQGNILAVYHENTVYKQEPIDWVTHANAVLRSAAGGSIPFNTNYVLPVWGGDPTFEGKIISYSAANTTFTNTQLTHPVSYFLSANTGLYLGMLAADTSYMIPLVNAERAGSDSIIGPALAQMIISSPQSFNKALSGVLGNAAANTRSMNAVCASGAMGDSMMVQLAQAFTDTLTDSEKALGCSTLTGIVNHDSVSASTLATKMLQLLPQYPSVLTAYAKFLGTDSLIYVDTVMSPLMTSAIEQALTSYGDESQLLPFFDNFSGSLAMLNHIASKSTLLSTVYGVATPAYLSAFETSFGDAYIDTAIAVAPKLSYGGYLSTAETYLGLSIDPALLATVNVLTQHTYSLAEHDLYGSSRLGIKNYLPQQIGLVWNYAANTIDSIRLWAKAPWYSLEYQDVINQDSINLYGNRFTGSMITQHILGLKQYELTDHLGDVLATVSDKRMPNVTSSISLPGGGTGLSISTWSPVVISSFDYYPFGEYMPGRYTSDSTSQCLITTLTEVEPVTTYNIIKWVDLYHGGQVTVIQTATEVTPDTTLEVLSHSKGDGIIYNITGLYPSIPNTVTLTAPKSTGTYMAVISQGSLVLGTYQLTGNQTGIFPMTFTPTSTGVTLKIYTNTLNTNIWLYNIKVPTTTMQPVSVVTTVCNNDWYRYGFNGKLKDNEWAGLGNDYDYGMRNYESRIGRPISIDPLFKKYPNLTPYQFFSDNPIRNIDIDGSEGGPAETTTDGRVNKGPVGSTYVQKPTVPDANSKYVAPNNGPSWLSRIFTKQRDSGPGADMDDYNSGGSDGSDKKYNPSPSGKGTFQADMNEFFKVLPPLSAETPKTAIDALDYVNTAADMAGLYEKHKEEGESKDSCTVCHETGNKGTIDPRGHGRIVKTKIKYNAIPKPTPPPTAPHFGL